MLVGTLYPRRPSGKHTSGVFDFASTTRDDKAVEEGKHEIFLFFGDGGVL